MASWFKGKRKDSGEDNTVEVRARVIADAVHAGSYVEQAPSGMLPVQYPPAAEAPQQQPPQQQAPQSPPQEEVELENDFRVEPALVSIAPEVYDQVLDERRALVALALYAHDRARSSGVAERIEAGLAEVGVTALRPDGDAFDPAVHEAGGTLDTGDTALDGTVAETEVVGFSDRGLVLRAPIVTVYRAGASTA
ncbi:nucleotide exchange factor GrpE [Actinokineospora spheciospongiae]|uniref:nucleotide exchange factor GrpE n=1 Tax=Actinokineospora spheciospongiae TaxID=909613 RepID=UPI000D8DA8A3|nr:nucleotide exchange factor GrpE [Actinokineospora spheciospongiae]PWW61874.1 GrpE protein [Actinokineospora spheciospongiae]